MGGNGAIARAEVANSAPDGYTLLSSFHALHAMLPHMTSKLRFDPNKDLVPIVHTLTVPNILVIHPSVPAKSLSELIAHAKANPGKLTFVSQVLAVPVMWPESCSNSWRASTSCTCRIAVPRPHKRLCSAGTSRCFSMP